MLSAFLSILLWMGLAYVSLLIWVGSTALAYRWLNFGRSGGWDFWFMAICFLLSMALFVMGATKFARSLTPDQLGDFGLLPLSILIFYAASIVSFYVRNKSGLRELNVLVHS